MIFIQGWAGAAYYAAVAGQFLAIAAVLLLLKQLLPAKRRRWLHFPAQPWGQIRISDQKLARWRLSRESLSYKERAALLSSCGLSYDPGLHLLLRLVVLGAAPLVMLGAAAWMSRHGGTVAGGAILMLAAAAFVLFLFDKALLRMWKVSRAGRVTLEVHAISVQLLYLQGSSLNIHAKLMRCIPYAGTIRNDLQRMLGEWYHDAEGAVRDFKQRIGTEDGMTFGETIDSLRLHDHETYYELLRERIRDYKDKLELLKESRKESSSYLLFLLAGIPILYTFQVFIYPWVRESQLLFNTLN